jgi:maltose alpha-D-glucosyltransferase/alpha-amylase
VKDPSTHAHVRGLSDEPTWYKDAIIYEIRTRSFFDSNDDGIGDFAGLESKLDYLQDLGVSALWLLPFYPSPGKDDGYDISDYTGVHPDVGTLADFEKLLEEAHRRGIRIITELVLNHTSDQHPWFQRARRAAHGSPERDFYVWGDSPARYADARIIFKDFEVSNWSWDREANAYYWHRFYAHQPDLNFENPAVHDALFEVVDFWLAKGVDGLRLDAVPYLYEAEGTNCENLPKTHAFLKKLRAHIDGNFTGRMLLAEANQWPEDAAAYFGQGDECHMNFHFPLMPRMFMAIHQEDRFPIIDIFAQTPEVNPTCQWALFLRNHDELTLEMVTEEERDYMYRAYAELPAMRINLGIRRRLAPLVGNSRRKIELLNGLLLSLPGTPVIYYGDEIGMGDNVYLGDRNGVRTPMQWSMDRNAGFSRANPQRLILPVNIDPQYHYESLNVENQQENSTSLLWWTKRLLALRKRYAAFGRGSIEFLSPDNSRVVAFVREHQAEAILVVANLSRFTQFATLDLSKHKGKTPVELFGKSRLPAIDANAYTLTLGPHDFYWFELDFSASLEKAGKGAPSATLECTSLDALLLGDERALLDEVIPAFLQGRYWFAGALRILASAYVVDVIPARTPSRPIWFVFVRAEYSDAPPELYVIPVTFSPADRPLSGGESAVVAFVRLSGDSEGSSPGALVDALADPESAHALLDAIAHQQRFRGKEGELVSSALEELAPTDVDRETEPREVGREHNQTTLRFGDRWHLKFLRRVDDGVSPEVDLGRFLARCASDVTPRLVATLEFVRPKAERMTIAVTHSYVPNEGTAWQFTLQELGRYYERVLARPATESCPPPPSESPIRLAGREPPPVVAEMMGSYRAAAAKLGSRVAELHLALAGNVTDPAFAPEANSALGVRAKYQSLRNLTGKVMRRLRERLSSLSMVEQREAAALLSRERQIVACFEPLLRTHVGGVRIRIHGNLDLQHALHTGKDFVLTDLHGHDGLTLFERQRKHSPVRDLAWMTRSFESAAFKLLLESASVRESDVDAARPWAMHWASWAAAAFIHAYFTATVSAPFIPSEPRLLAVQFDALLLERALYQLSTELEDPSGQAMIALLGIGRTLLTQRGAPSGDS